MRKILSSYTKVSEECLLNPQNIKFGKYLFYNCDVMNCNIVFLNLYKAKKQCHVISINIKGIESKYY